MLDLEVPLDDRTFQVREVGDPAGTPLLHFHGTPSSRFEMDLADSAAQDLGVRIVAFDRPGYGGSTPGRFSLRSIAVDAGAIADALGISSFAVSGQSGGGPFALAAAAVLGPRVLRVGVLSGAGPFEHIPEAMAMLDDNDAFAVSLLPDDPEGAARQFGQGFAPLREHFLDPNASPTSAFEPALSTSDKAYLSDPVVQESLDGCFRTSLVQGVTGGGWDNVAWVGPWDIDLADVRCPVHLWYADEDKMAPPFIGRWLAANLADAHYVERAGEGHMSYLPHIREVLSALTG